jgi:tripartite-type tricarboxylate transporter receptor subunit TctC
MKSLLLAVAALILLPAGALADNAYPTRPIRLIVGFTAGSSGDVAARIIGNKLGNLLGQSVVVENKAGASGMIATEFVARAPKDGYTLLLATIAAAINATIMPDRGPDLQKDLAPVALVGSLPNILVVAPNLTVSNVKELIALAKSKPGELLYGAAGVGSGPHLTTELFAQMAGIKITSVLYPGSAQTVTDLIAGRIQIMFAPASTVLGLIRQGTVKALATTEKRRAGIAPELPTISEAALPDFDTGLWFGILAPGGTPPAITEKLAKATNEALKDPDVLNQFRTQGFEPLGGSPDDFARFIASETERWARVAKSIDLQKKN